MRQRDASDASSYVGWQASAVRGEEVRCFRKVASMSIVAADGPCFVVDTLTVDGRMT